MTQTAEPQTKTSLHSLRDALEQAERQIVRLDRSNIQTFLVGNDQIEQMFAAYGQDKNAIRAEETRWNSLRKRIETNPALVVSAAANAGGLSKLRSQHPPALGSWWHVDSEIKRRRTQMLQRTGLLFAGLLAVVLILWGVFSYLPTTSELTDTTANIEQLVAAQQWPEALVAVQQARQTLPDDPELLIWDAVLNEQGGAAAQAQTSLAQAQQKFVGQPAEFWTLVGRQRQQVGNLAGAEAAGQQALTTAPQDAQVTFLLGSVAEDRGDLVQAAAYFSQTIALAGDTNPELGVITKVRMGNLMQAVQPLPVPAPVLTQTVAP